MFSVRKKLDASPLEVQPPGRTWIPLTPFNLPAIPRWVGGAVTHHLLCMPVGHFVPMTSSPYDTPHTFWAGCWVVDSPHGHFWIHGFLPTLPPIFYQTVVTTARTGSPSSGLPPTAARRFAEPVVVLNTSGRLPCMDDIVPVYAPAGRTCLFTFRSPHSFTCSTTW